MSQRSPSTLWPAALAALWLVAVVAGLGALVKYKTTPGAAASTPERWPADSHLSRSTTLPTLVMLAHPRCPCTRASMGELAKLMAKLGGKLSAKVLFSVPSAEDEGWTHSGLWEQAQAIPGVEALKDLDGAESQRFGARTSGQTLLYAADGQLLFAGGITESRGHAGENLGSQRVASWVLTGTADKNQAPVFGCALQARGGNVDEPR